MARRRSLGRDRRLMLVFGAIAVGSLTAAGWQMAVAGVPPETAYTEITVVPQRAGSVSVAVAGDTMFGDGAQALIDAQGTAATLAGVTAVLSAADVTVVNMEAPITAITEVHDFTAQLAYRSAPESADALAAAGVDVLQLGNNHAMDRGGPGLADTVANASRTGMVTVGAGADRAEAARPLLIRTDGLTVALVSLGEDFGRAERSGDATPGMVPFSADTVIQGERVARRAGADRVIALVHWGDSYAEPSATQRHWAGELVAAGYDVVIGTGPHILQPVEVVDGVPVVYSIGNLVFGSRGRHAAFGRPGLGAVATVTFDARGGTLALQCVSTDNTVVDYVSRECDASESAVAENELRGGMEWQAPVGTLRF